MGCPPALDVDLAGARKHADRRVVGRRAECEEPPGIRVCLSVIGEVRHGTWQPGLAYGQTVGPRLMGKIFQCEQAPGAGHVFNDDGWMARHVPSEILSDRASVQVVGATR